MKKSLNLSQVLMETHFSYIFHPHQYYPGGVGASHSVDSMGKQLPNDGAA